MFAAVRRLISKGGACASVAAFSLLAPDAAFACRAVVGDFVWLDANGNGIQDAGEAGIPNVLVTLEALDGTVLKTVVTSETGFYTFENRLDKTQPPLCEQTYVIKVTTPPGLVPTALHQGSDPTRDSNDPRGARVTPTDVPDFDGLAEDLTIDFGFVPERVCTGAIGDFVWFDANNDGRQDAGEGGFVGVVMTLAGTASGTGATAAGGAYQFRDLCAGTYTVCADIPAGFQPSPTQAAGVPATLDSNGTSNGAGSSCASVTLVGDSSVDNTIDFGFGKLPVASPGTGTPGYWKNHPEAWPVTDITIGGVVYSKSTAIAYMASGDGDKTLTMFRALVAAKLNVLIGNDASCIASTISAADTWMSTYGPVGNGVRARSMAWKSGEPLYWALDAYNNGDRCAPARD